jgi:pimeloyl-ACP methyl ester carboxylesterase
MVMIAAPGVSGQASTKNACETNGRAADSFCTIDGVRLHYVDWGGEGPAIILLSGLGDSARTFDDLAPRLAHGHHVYAFTRRGYGLSDHSQTDYSNAALIGDIVGMMDALSISRASFVGHSIAGGELSAMGAKHPDRVARLVYLDSAYDWTRAFELTSNVPAMPPPSAADRATLDALARWREAALGVHVAAVRDNLADVMERGASGLVAKTPPGVTLAVLKGEAAASPDYAQIAAPALAIYASKDVADQIPAATAPAQRRRIVAYFIHNIRPWMLRQQADFLAQKPCGVAVELPDSTHYFYLRRPAWTARTILGFVGTKDACNWTVPTSPEP